jgi:hypothetical protein
VAGTGSDGFSGRWIDDRFHFLHACDGKLSGLGVLANQVRISRDIDTINFISSDVTFSPLDFGPMFLRPSQDFWATEVS